VVGLQTTYDARGSEAEPESIGDFKRTSPLQQSSASPPVFAGKKAKSEVLLGGSARLTNWQELESSK